MFGLASLNAPSPAFERLFLELPPHKPDDFFFLQAKLMLDGFERGPILPGHLYDSIDLFSSKSAVLHPVKNTINKTLYPKGIEKASVPRVRNAWSLMRSSGR